MPPTPMNPGQVRVVDPVLTTFARGYGIAEHIGLKLAPAVPVMVRAGKIVTFGKEAWKIYDSQRARGGATKRIQYGYGSDSYLLENHAIEAGVPDEDREDASMTPGVDLAKIAIALTLNSELLNLEYQIANLLTSAANYDNNHKVTVSGADLWSADTSKPLTQIRDRIETIRNSVGLRPNTLAVSAVAFEALIENPDTRDRFKYVSKESISADMIAAQLGLKQVLVGDAVYADESDTSFDVWGDNAILSYCPMVQGSIELTQFQPAHAYTYVLKGHPAVKKPYYDDNAETWFYGIKYERQPVISGQGAGFLFANPAFGD